MVQNRIIIMEIIGLFFLAILLLFILGFMYMISSYLLYSMELGNYLKQAQPKLWTKISIFSEFWSLSYLDTLKKIVLSFKFNMNNDYLDDDNILFLKNKIRFWFKLSFSSLLGVFILALILSVLDKFF